jgi:hypothetical protein
MMPTPKQRYERYAAWCWKTLGIVPANFSIWLREIAKIPDHRFEEAESR